MHILVTGGVGYVGSHLVRALLDEGHSVAIVDDLSSGHRQTLADGVALEVGRCGDAATLDRIGPRRTPDAVMHVAAKCSVEESVSDPGLYYQYNVHDSLALLDWMVANGVKHIVHSSTCAVYGCPEEQPIGETVCPRPVNPYGASKLAVDTALAAYEGAYDISAVALRYFNAAGAHPEGILGEDKTPASNLIPCVFDVALGKRPTIDVFGNDYDTPDGTGVRDYIHVTDLAAAHIAALNRLADGGSGGVYNLGTGKGHSVLDVVKTAREVTGHEIPTRDAPRRTGDPPALIADPTKARSELGWSAQRGALITILEDAWRWREQHRSGYEPGAVPA